MSTSPAFIANLNGTKIKYFRLRGISAPRTIIENDVWLGTGVYIKSGCVIHTGAVIGMGSVVTHDVGAYEIWAGNPARKIGDRFDDLIKMKILESQWWNYDDEELKSLGQYFDNPEQFVDEINKTYL